MKQNSSARRGENLRYLENLCDKCFCHFAFPGFQLAFFFFLNVKNDSGEVICTHTKICLEFQFYLNQVLRDLATETVT